MPAGCMPSRVGRRSAFVFAVFILSGAGQRAQALEDREFDLAKLPAPPIVSPTHIGEIELHWECAHLTSTPRVPPGWEVELRYAEDEGSLRVHHVADVIELADFVPIPLDALPSLKLVASADCFDYEISIREGLEGSTLTGCERGPWNQTPGSSRWERAECVQ